MTRNPILAHDAIDVMDDDNPAIALEDQIQRNVAWIWTVRKQSIESIILTK